MAFGVAASGSTAMSTGTYVQLNGAAFTSANVYSLSVNTTPLVNGEALMLKVTKKVASGGSEVIVDELVISNHAQTNVVKETKPYDSHYSISFYLKQVGGSNRTLEWLVTQYN